MTKYLSTFIIKAVKNGNVKAVHRYLSLHKRNHALLNASEEYKIGMGIFNTGNTTGWRMDRLTHLAIRHSQTKILAALLACNGIDVNLTNRDLMTPLRLAVSYRNLEAVTMLLSHPDIKIDAVDFNGDTALMFAARMANLEIVKILLEHGADKTKKNQIGYDAANEAEAFGRQEIHDFITAYQPPEQSLVVTRSTLASSLRPFM
jgi:ankyrin repeat protein